MNQLKVISFNGKLVTDSREVAEMVGKSHDQLMRSIRKYVEYLTSAKMQTSEFFVSSTYKDSKNESRPCFLITKKGCDMVANKMTGEKGVLFTAEYVTRFEEMEKQQPKILSDKEQLMASMKLSIEHNEKIEQHDERITNLEETMRIDGAQEHTLNKKGKKVVMEALGGKSSPAYKSMAFKVFSAFWRDFKNHFEIPRYGDLPKKQFEEGLRFIGMWQPSTSLKIEIDETNNQQTLEGVI
ncbi:ORF6C domain-containing protein [Virgibacillus sp. AGTR]|uniref:ORF6C domain-containing protein n=1 Tax=Virgibacillus sp. AGTR TaxID=2812055 RepID=UPI001964A826|nr:ORF6C domain-containing protein [Virgibacillus sp. AGTR]MCC2250030.1 ORF6C domain-containing protein [Virgibacillus sp. AGTR]QRZ17793.1 ORF6C domain-containing protein [Virgibacillus sp. AGTR]